jgi:GDPmannose 4,6-dehydratase
VETLLGDPTKARTKLGWEPQISFEALVQEMVKQDLKNAGRDKLCADAGYSVCVYDE